MNAVEAIRLAKANRMVALLDRAAAPEPMTAQLLDDMGAEAWDLLAEAEGRPLSPATREVVRAVLSGRDNLPADPFAGIAPLWPTGDDLIAESRRATTRAEIESAGVPAERVEDIER